MNTAVSGLLLAWSAFAYGLATFHSGQPFVDYSIVFNLPPALVPPASTSKSAVDTHALIRGAAEKHNVPAAFVRSIVAAESNFDCDAVSAKGAIGLMQLMPATAREYGADPTVPEQNIDAGTRYLRVLMDRYRKHRHPLASAIAAYNAGPTVVDRYHGVPPFRETRRYVVRVLSFWRRFQKESGQPPPASAPGEAGTKGNGEIAMR